MSASLAQAGGWLKVSPSDPIGTVYWRNDDPYPSTDSPHGGFLTTTNRCKLCHSVHEAGENSYRLLKSGNTTETRSKGERNVTGTGNARATECMYCHDADTGLSQYRPYGVLYEFGFVEADIRGEHSLGATWMPDSSANGTDTAGPSTSDVGRDGFLDCYQCHSVHGANIVSGIFAWGYGNSSESIERYILTDDPAGNGNDANTGIGSIQAPPGGWKDGQSKADPNYPSSLDTTSTYGSWKYEIMAAWCGDCHNLNPNITGPNDFRPNPRSHPIFGGPDSTESTSSGGWMEVYGQNIQVSGASPKGCDGCHMSGQKIGGQDKMSWPHQSTGSKFLITVESSTPMNFQPIAEGVKSGPGDSLRVIPDMDQACLWCHQFDAAAKGVGLTF